MVIRSAYLLYAGEYFTFWLEIIAKNKNWSKQNIKCNLLKRIINKFTIFIAI